MEHSHFSNTGRGLWKDDFCEIILTWSHWLGRFRLNNFFYFWRRYHLKIFLFFSSSGHLVQCWGTILAILRRAIREIFVWNFEIKPLFFKDFSTFSSGGHLVQWSRNILTILLQGHERTFLWNWYEIEPLAWAELMQAISPYTQTFKDVIK